MSKFYEHISESLWSDLQNKSLGNSIRKEDCVNSMSVDDFFGYLVSKYKDKVLNLDKDHFCKDYEMDIVVEPNKDIVIYGNYINDELVRIMVVLRGSGKTLNNKVSNIIKKSPDNYRWIRIYSDKLEFALHNEDVTNQTYVDLIDFFLNNIKLFESLWSDLQNKSLGNSKRTEDIVHLDDKYKDKFEICLKRFVENVVYNEEFKNTIEDFKRFIKKGRACVGAVGVGSSTKPFIEVIEPYIDDNWNKYDNIHKQINDRVLEENRKISKLGFKKEPGKSICDTIFDWWDTLNDYKKWDLIEGTSAIGQAEERFYETHLDDDEFTGEDLNADDMIEDCTWEELVGMYVTDMTKNESLWSDLQNKSIGISVRREDERHKILERLLATYIKLFADSCYYHNEYTSGSYPDFREYIKDFRDNPRIEEVCPDDSYFDDLLNYVNRETWDNQIDDTIMEITDRIDKGEHLITDDVIEELRKHNVNESLWSDLQNKSIGKSVRREDEYDINEDELERSVNTCIKAYVSGFVYSDKYDGSSDTFLKCIQEWDRYICPNVQLYDRRTRKPVESIKVIPSYIKKNWETGKSYKSLVEKAISEEEKKVKDTGFVKKPGESISDTLSKWFDENAEELDQDFCEEIEEYNAEYHREGGSRYTDLGVDEWWYDLKYIEQVEIYQEYMKKTNESIWSDLQNKSIGISVRREDDMTDDDFLMLRATAKMFQVGVRNYENPKNRKYAPRRIDSCEGFIDYILEKKKEHFWNGVPDKTYDKVINFVEKNWEEGKGIQEFIDMYLSHLNECDGVPGGLTPADVGGMGPAYFPGPNGEPGSGDLPSPTGKVYQQVAPFGIFVNNIYGKRKKKKKKKFRKEDEPCVHSPNAKVYDYVDDFREYVDRTYNNIDRRK